MKIIKLAKKSSALKQSVGMMLGNTFASGIAAIALIIFSRFLGPEKFGIFSIGFSVVLLLTRLSDAGVNIAIQKYIAQNFESNKSLTNRFIQASYKIKTLATLFILITFFLLSNPISTYWLKTNHTSIVQIAIILTIPTVMYEYAAVIHQSTRKFKHAIFMNIYQAIAKAFLAIGIWALNIKDPFIAFIFYMASPFVGVFYGIIKFPKWIKFKYTKLDQQVKNKILSIIKFTSIAVAAGAIGDNIDVLIVKSYLTEYDTGLYSAGSRLAILISMLGYSLGTVLNPRVARYKDSKHFYSYTKKAFLISIIAILSTAIVVPFTKTLIILTAGRQYIQATSAVQYLLTAGMVAVATTPFVSMFYVLEKPAYFAASGIVQTISLIIANIILIPQVGILGAGQAKMIMRIITFLFTLLYANFAIKHTHKKSLINILFSK